MPSIKDMKQQLEQSFGAIEIKPIDGKISATVSGFAAYGRNNFFLSYGGVNEQEAIAALFNQITQSARSTNEKMHPASTSHVYNGDKTEILYDPAKGFVTSKNKYDDKLGF